MKDRRTQEHAGLQVRFGYSVTASSTAHNGNVELGQYLYELDTDPTIQHNWIDGSRITLVLPTKAEQSRKKSVNFFSVNIQL